MAIPILDLFAGAGGFSLGFEHVKNNKGNNVFELHRAVEIEGHECETLRRNYGKEKVIQGDITDKEIHKKIVKECKDKIRIIIGGIPCQSFSTLGTRSGRKKKKEDKRDNLYKEYYKLVKILEPEVIVIENVRGILSKKDKNGNLIFSQIIRSFERIGYKFSNDRNRGKHLLLNAADYGVPQNRKRVFIIGLKKDVFGNRKIPYPEPTHGEETNEPYLTIADAIGDLPRLQPEVTFTGLNEEEHERVIRRNRRRNPGKDIISIDKNIFRKHIEEGTQPREEFFSFVRPNGYKHINHHVCRSHQLSDLQLFDAMKQGWTAKDVIKKGDKKLRQLIKYDMNSFKDKYRRQKWDEPCTTVFAHLKKDGNRFIHPLQTRTFTPREAARIQSFPDHFIFEGPFTTKFRQIGNAVPPLLAYHVATSVCEVMKQIK